MTDKQAQDLENQPFEYINRICELEYRLVKTRDALLVITRSLEDFAQSETVAAMSDEEISIVFGTVTLLESVAEECGKTVEGKK